MPKQGSTPSSPTGSPPAGLAATAFFGKTYDEAYALLIEARHYVELEAPRPGEWSQPILGLVHSQEAMRVTARLAYIMAWLLAKRAVHAGEITPEESAAPRWRLDGRELCLEMGGELSPEMPARLRELLTRSRNLYIRIARLDDMVERDPPWPVAPLGE